MNTIYICVTVIVETLLVKTRKKMSRIDFRCTCTCLYHVAVYISCIQQNCAKCMVHFHINQQNRITLGLLIGMPNVTAVARFQRDVTPLHALGYSNCPAVSFTSHDRVGDICGKNCLNLVLLPELALNGPPHLQLRICTLTIYLGSLVIRFDIIKAYIIIIMGLLQYNLSVH